MRRLGALALVLVVAALWAVACGDGGGGGDGGVGPDGATPGASPDATTTPGATGTPGSSEAPLPSGTTAEVGPLEIEIDVERWELLRCLPLPEEEPDPETGRCSDQTFPDRTLRLFVSVHNSSDTDAVEGPFRFTLVSDGTAYAVIVTEEEDSFLFDTSSVGPGETIEGWVYSIRPDIDLWQQGRVSLRADIGTDLSPETVRYWEIPPP